MLARCKKAGVPASMITVGGEAPHGFWMQPQWAADTVKQSAEFFHSVLDRLTTGI
jgi:acetyl esterase/lipase